MRRLKRPVVCGTLVKRSICCKEVIALYLYREYLDLQENSYMSEEERLAKRNLDWIRAGTTLLRSQPVLPPEDPETKKQKNT